MIEIHEISLLIHYWDTYRDEHSERINSEAISYNKFESVTKNEYIIHELLLILRKNDSIYWYTLVWLISYTLSVIIEFLTTDYKSISKRYSRRVTQNVAIHANRSCCVSVYRVLPMWKSKTHRGHVSGIGSVLLSIPMHPLGRLVLLSSLHRVCRTLEGTRSPHEYSWCCSIRVHSEQQVSTRIQVQKVPSQESPRRCGSPGTPLRPVSMIRLVCLKKCHLQNWRIRGNHLPRPFLFRSMSIFTK